VASIEDPSIVADEAPQGLAALLGGVRQRKLLSFGIALLIEALILLLLLTLGARIAGDPASTQTVTEFAARDFSEPVEPEAEQPPEAQPEDSSTPVETPPVPDQPTPLDLPEPERPKPPITSNPTPAPPPPPSPPPPAEPAPRPSPSIAARINPNRTYGPADSGPPRTSMDSERVGTAPNGEPLYAARWYREPTQQELAGYLSTARSPGVALIACRTVPDYYVEDCVLLSESPAGSLMGRAALAASWQFRVRPARIGGREQFGSWVRIRVSYTVSRGAR
jgi:protein TonB